MFVPEVSAPAQARGMKEVISCVVMALAGLSDGFMVTISA